MVVMMMANSAVRQSSYPAVVIGNPHESRSHRMNFPRSVKMFCHTLCERSTSVFLLP